MLWLYKARNFYESSCETFIKGTDLFDTDGKEDPIELDSCSFLLEKWLDVEYVGVFNSNEILDLVFLFKFSLVLLSYVYLFYNDTKVVREFGWGGTLMRLERWCPRVLW